MDLKWDVIILQLCCLNGLVLPVLIGRLVAVIGNVWPGFMQRSDLMRHAGRVGLCGLAALVLLLCFGHFWVTWDQNPGPMWASDPPRPPNSYLDSDGRTLKFELWLRIFSPVRFQGTCLSGNAEMCALADAEEPTPYLTRDSFSSLFYILFIASPALVAIFTVWFFTRKRVAFKKKKKRQKPREPVYNP